MVATYGPAPGATPDPDYSLANVLWNPKRMRFTVHEVGTDDLIATPSAYHGARILDALDDEGSFVLNVQADDPNLPLITKGMLLRAWKDANAIWTGLIERRKVRPIGQGAERFTTLMGVGQVKLLDRLLVYPPGGLGRFPFSDDRTFDWTAPEFDDSGWDPVVITPANYGLSTENYGLPEGFPDGDAEWIWDEPSSSSVPAGTKYFRGVGTAPSTRVREAWGASDDTFTAYLQGIEVVRSNDTAYVGRTFASELLVSSGAIQGAIRTTNLNPLKAGQLFSLLTPLDDTEAPTLHTDDTWLVMPSANPLGMNPGEIMVTLLSEASARAEIIPAVTFTAALDSNGDPWTLYEQLTVRIGDSVWDVLRQMVDLQMCEFRMSPDAYELNLYDADGAGSATGLTLDSSNLTQLEFDDEDVEATALLVRWERGFTDTEDAALVTAHGRRGGFLALGGVRSETTAQDQGDKVLSRMGERTTQTKAAYDPASRAVEPYGSAGPEPGDSLTLPDIDGGTESQRVLQIETRMDSTGLPVFGLALNSILVERAKRVEVTLRRLANGTLGGRSGTSTIPYLPRPVRPREPEPIRWSEVGPVQLGVGAIGTFERAIRVREMRVNLAVASSSGDVEVDLLKNGTTVATVTLSSGEVESYIPITDLVYSQRPADKMEVEITSAGTGADTITITVVYA
jgi:hypothetical protein